MTGTGPDYRPHLAVIGATSATGRFLVDQAVAEGHLVRAVARRPDRLAARGAQEVAAADVRDASSLLAAVEGVDVVVSVFGIATRRAALRPEALYSEGAANLVRAMAVAGVRRLVIVSSSGVVDAPGDGWFYRSVLKRFVLARMYSDMRLMEDEVRAADLDATIVRPPQLVDGPLRRRYRVSADGPLPDDTTLSRADLADFLLTEARTGDFSGRTVSISD